MELSRTLHGSQRTSPPNKVWQSDIRFIGESEENMNPGKAPDFHREQEPSALASEWKVALELHQSGFGNTVSRQGGIQGRRSLGRDGLAAQNADIPFPNPL